MALPDALTSKIRSSSVPVMNPEKRRLIRKTVVELFVVLRYMAKLCQGDILFVSCVLPTTLWLLEVINRVWRKTGVYVVLHGEIEGLFDTSLPSIRSFGYWVNKWMRSRKPGSQVMLVVLDDFIRDRLVHEYPEKMTTANISVIHHPVIPLALTDGVFGEQKKPSVCFIGYRSRFKGFDAFAQMALDHLSINFLAIGGAKVENISTGTVEELRETDAYLGEISKCSAALFPYTALYSCSLSAAALDALAAGVPIIALDRPFFRSLGAYFGSDVVTVSRSLDELSQQLDSSKLSLNQKTRASRLERLSNSKYGLAAVQRSFERLVSSRAL